MPFLFDVNLLVAMAWPRHVHHDLAHRWFSRHRRAGWATCPATQAGFLRVSANPRFSSDAVTPRQAFELLADFTALPDHLFWADDKPLTGSAFFDSSRLVGYRQVTDAHLLAIALRHGGALATFDAGYSALLPSGWPASAVQLIPSR